MEGALIAVRLGQYVGSAGLFGGALLLVRQPTDALPGRERRFLLASSILLALSTVAALVVQSDSMAGETTPFAKPAMVGMVLTGTGFGYAVVVRIAGSVLALAVLFRAKTRRALAIVTGLGAMATASLAWGGHGMADQGLAGIAHLGGDVTHLLAANAWIGALGALMVMAAGLGGPDQPSKVAKLQSALAGFSGFGTLAVALLIATGLVNSWFLIGPTHLGALTTTAYGELLLAKLVVFLAMLALAALNRWRLTPSLEATATAHGNLRRATAQVKTSVAIETTLALAVVLIVSWLGTLAPPNAG